MRYLLFLYLIGVLTNLSNPPKVTISVCSFRLATHQKTSPKFYKASVKDQAHSTVATSELLRLTTCSFILLSSPILIFCRELTVSAVSVKQNWTEKEGSFCLTLYTPAISSGCIQTATIALVTRQLKRRLYLDCYYRISYSPAETKACLQDGTNFRVFDNLSLLMKEDSLPSKQNQPI